MTNSQKLAQERYRERHKATLREDARERSRKFRETNPAADKAIAQRFRKSRRVFVDNLKSNPCIDCGQSFPPECMDFDHVRGKKVAGIYQMYTKSMARLLAEIEKCDLVCANCHRIRTQKRTRNLK